MIYLDRCDESKTWTFLEADKGDVDIRPEHIGPFEGFEEAFDYLVQLHATEAPK